MEACDTCRKKKDRKGEGKEEKQRNPEEVEKVLAKGNSLSLRRRSRRAQRLQGVVKDIPQKLFG